MSFCRYRKGDLVKDTTGHYFVFQEYDPSTGLCHVYGKDLTQCRDDLITVYADIPLEDLTNGNIFDLSPDSPLLVIMKMVSANVEFFAFELVRNVDRVEV